MRSLFRQTCGWLLLRPTTQPSISAPLVTAPLVTASATPLFRSMRFMASCGLIASLLLSLPAAAEPAFARQYKAEFGYMPSCGACHANGGGSALNAYGEQFDTHRNNSNVFADIAALDADSDGHSNQTEAKQKANPADAESYPGQLGNWLSIDALIPKQVRALFPDVNVYKPLDTVLTEKEIARAKTFGVELSRADENVIYIPLQERQPLGTAIIVPAEHANNRFYLLVSTDKQLVITQVQALDSSDSPDLSNEALFANLAGQTVNDIQLTQDNSLADAIRAATKRAVALIYVRLKKS